MRPTTPSFLFVLVLLVTTGAVAEDGQDRQDRKDRRDREDRPIVAVSNVGDLYAAVADPANDGAILALAPGTYVLDNAPGHGNLVLRAGMDLVGPNEYVRGDDGLCAARDAAGNVYADPATEAVIDGRTLKGFNNVSLPRYGAIEAGRENTIAGLTVKGVGVLDGRPSLTALVDVNLAPGHVVIRNCVLDGGRRGIRLYGVADAGLRSTAVVEGNVIRNQRGNLGFGFEVQNIDFGNTSWDVTLRANILEHNFVGLATFNDKVGASGNEISILSMRNAYRNNDAGLVLQTGRDGGSGNREEFLSIDDSIVDNVGTSVAITGLAGGLLAMGAFATGPFATSNNALRVELLGTTFITGPGDPGNLQGTARRDVTVFGAFALGTAPAGTGNTVELLVRRATSDGAPGAFVTVDSQPADPSGSDKVTIIGSDLDGDESRRAARSD